MSGEDEVQACKFHRVVELGIQEGIIPPEQNVDVYLMITDGKGNLRTARGFVDGFHGTQSSEV